MQISSGFQLTIDSTAKFPGMFGTLIICLPSQHTGGVVCLQHGGKSVRFETSENSAFDGTFIAWFVLNILLFIIQGSKKAIGIQMLPPRQVDPLMLYSRFQLILSGKIEPVKTGYRWVLTYHLINESQNPLGSASALAARTKDFAQALKQWRDVEDAPQYLTYPLDHQYTNEDLKLTQLKSDDYHRVYHVFQSSTVHNKFYIFLANVVLHITTHWTDDGEDEEEHEEVEVEMPYLVNLEGVDLTIRYWPTISNKSLLSEVSFGLKLPYFQRPEGAGDYKFFNESVSMLNSRLREMSDGLIDRQ